LTAATGAVERGRIRQFAVNGHKPADSSGADYWTEAGRIRVVGYNDMLPLLTAMNGLFSELHPGVDFELDLKGTRTAPPALTAGRSAFAPMGAEFSEAALEEFRRETGSDPLAIRVAHGSLNPQALSGPLAFFVHQDNPLKQISVDDSMRVFSQVENSPAIETWGQLGLDGDWAQRRIEPCGLVPSTALASFLHRHKFDGRPFSDAVSGFPQSRDAVEFAASHPHALCFAALNRRVAGVIALAVSEHNDEPAYAATAEAVTGGVYPLDRYLYIYVRKYNDPVIDTLVTDYLRMVLSRAGQALVASTPPGYLPLNAHEIETELAKLADTYPDFTE
jgi:phosphate transport system substrate-binding protein